MDINTTRWQLIMKSSIPGAVSLETGVQMESVQSSYLHGP